MIMEKEKSTNTLEDMYNNIIFRNKEKKYESVEEQCESIHSFELFSLYNENEETTMLNHVTINENYYA
jgi:hypothetical protein